MMNNYKLYTPVMNPALGFMFPNVQVADVELVKEIVKEAGPMPRYRYRLC